jgi:hypothetical protein
MIFKVIHPQSITMILYTNLELLRKLRNDNELITITLT